MAQITIVTVTCDFPHLDEMEAAQSVTIGWEGRQLEADACDPHALAIRDAIGPYIECMRPIRPKHHQIRGQNGSKPAKRSPEKRQQDREIRAWARGKGLNVSDRGRLPAGIIAKYMATH